MDVSAGAWAITCAAIIAIFVFDFFANVRKPHEPTFRESATWSAFYVGLAVVFGLVVWWRWGLEFGGEYFAGYITEKALSVDNLFVFTLIMSSFAVPRKYQAKLLLIGIVLALAMRMVFIAIGAAVISAFSWSFYIFGVVLILTAVKLAGMKAHSKAHTPESPGKPDDRLAAIVRRFVPTSDSYDGDKFFTVVDGRRAVTPMLLALLTIAFTAGMFGLDSILAIYGLTEQSYIVVTANAFALMGMRELYFLIGGLLDRLIYLSLGLSIVLGFIGVDLILHALHKNSLPFVNQGRPVNVPEISTATAITFITLVLVVTVVASLLRTRGRATPPAGG